MTKIDLYHLLIPMGGYGRFLPMTVNAWLDIGDPDEGDRADGPALARGDGIDDLVLLDRELSAAGAFSPTGLQFDCLEIQIDGFILRPDGRLIGSYFYASRGTNNPANAWHSKAKVPDGYTWFPETTADVLLFEIVEIDGNVYLQVVR